MGTTRSILTLAVATSLAASSPALAAAGLSTARTISGTGSAEQPQVAVGAAGRTLAVWNRQGGRFDLPKGQIDARLGQTGGSWGATQTLSTSGSGPLAAVGSDSVAAVAWATLGAKRSNTIYVSIARAGHSFGRAVRVTSGVGVGGPTGLEVQPDGRVVVVWVRGIPTPAAQPYRENVDFGLIAPGAQTLHTGLAGIAGRGSPTAALTADGTVLVASPTVLQLPGSGAPDGNQQGQVVTLSPGAQVFTSLPEIFAVPGDANAEADGLAAVAGPGGAGVAFSAEGIQPNLLELAPMLPSGFFGPPVAAASIDISSGLVGYAGPVLALPGDGAQIAAFELEQLDSPTDEAVVSAQIMAAVRPSGAAAFAAPTRLSGPPGVPSAPVSASAGGSTVVLWGQSTGCHQQVYASVRPAGGAFGPARAVAGAFTTQQLLCGHANNTQLGVSGAGSHTIAGWLQGSKLDVATLSAQ
ncbi:MAG TPA: hypothetical protein VG165_06705 [Solirubrobacteraceae bacterium]|jgi:hypothetical protein|nr:hypothetical protein [Solirubrobacteraceae bacterium]